MNEQLVVKNFGPIKDATVDFKRVTVFIGPTGGGKSTLAKLAAVFRNRDFLFGLKAKARHHLFDSLLSNYGILNYTKPKSEFEWASEHSSFYVSDKSFSLSEEKRLLLGLNLNEILQDRFPEYQPGADTDNITASSTFLEEFEISLPPELLDQFDEIIGKFFSEAIYIPADRAFASAIEGAIFSLRRKNTALPFALENFLGLFEVARKYFPKIELPVFDIQYNYRRGENLLKLKNKETIDLAESASGIQSALPLMLVVEYLSSIRKVHSFVAEEPELSLYPTAQQGLLNWLVKKCTKGENDLTITTHSPYILSHLNLLLYAYQVAEQHPDRAEDVAKVVPRENWINPKEFAAYHVEGQKENGVHSIVNPETGLISYNGLDALAGSSADEFDKLLDISAGLEVE